MGASSLPGALALALALGVAAGCGDGGSCPSLDGVRARLAAAPPFVPSPLPTVATVDGEGRHDGAVVVRLVPGDEPDALVVEVDGQPAPARPSDRINATVADEVAAVLATGRPRVIELEAPPRAKLYPLQTLLSKLAPHGDVRLVVMTRVPPPYERLPSWALIAAATVGADASVELARAIERAAGTACRAELERRLVAAGPPGDRDDAALRSALPDALAACRCRGADVRTLAWLYEQVAFPDVRTGWLRVNAVEHGTPVPIAVPEYLAYLEAVSAVPAPTRVAGVWARPR
ncbi:MAG: hypothetical protein HS111_19105 [Kofleriaceae bacterium]|nr:hypothetical protein [Kofleriaceae bacterium]MCL4228008.1 hypothetical protein [Myxococcales bacterium]